MNLHLHRKEKYSKLRESVSSLVGESRPLLTTTGKRIQRKRRTSILLDSLAAMQVKRNFQGKVNCRHCRSHQLHRRTARGLLKGDRQRGYVPTRYQNSRMREFNREFGYKTRKHPFACCLSDIRRWIPSDNRKDCRPIQHSTVSVSDDQSLSIESESCALHIERLLNTGSPTDVQHSRPQPSRSMLDTSLGDSQEDATFRDVIIEGANNEQQNARHSPLAAEDRHELPVNTCPPLFGYVDRFYDASSVDISEEEEDEVISPLPSAQPEIDKTGSRRNNKRHNIGTQSHVIVHPTWLPTFQSEYSNANEEQGTQRSSRSGCLRANGSLAIVRRGQDKDAVHVASSIHSLSDVAQSQQSETRPWNVYRSQ